MTKISEKLPISEIEIYDFIFHVVHHGEDEPKLMNSTPITGFEIFFKQRIVEIIEGNRFLFQNTSMFKNNIDTIANDKSVFVEISKQLAILFHKDDERIKPGVMILMEVVISEKRGYILLKYDHAEVVTYSTNQNGEAILSEIKNSFSKDKDALQKAAIVFLAENYAIVNDLSNKTNITKFFKDFLGVYRQYSEKALTEKLKKSFMSTVRHFKDDLPTHFTSQAARLFHEIIQNQESFDKATFLDLAFGAYSLNKVEKVFDKELKKEDIYGEAFIFDKNLPAPNQKKYKTNEGVVIFVSENAKDTISIINEPTQSIITITTQKLTEFS